jgi:hypothetical protein
VTEQSKARQGRAGQVCRELARLQEGVRTDPEWVEVVLVMLSQLLMRVTGSELGPAGHSSLSGIA